MSQRVSIRDALWCVDVLEECIDVGGVPQDWQSHLATRITDSIGGAGGVLAVSLTCTGGMRVTESQMTAGLDPAVHLSFERFSREGAFARLPEFARIAPVLVRRGGIAYRQVDLISRRTFIRSDFYQCYLREHEMEDHVSAVRRVDGVGYFGISVHRTGRDLPFAQRDEDLLRLLVELCAARLAPGGEDGRKLPVRLTPRLSQTLDALLTGASEKEMAHQLGLSQSTVHQYVQTLYRLYQVRSRSELMACYLRRSRCLATSLASPANGVTPRLI